MGFVGFIPSAMDKWLTSVSGESRAIEALLRMDTVDLQNREKRHVKFIPDYFHSEKKNH